MGTPGDKFPIDKVVHSTGSSSSPPTPHEETSDITTQPPAMTILRTIPSLGIFVGHEQPMPELHTLDDLDKQLLLDSESDNSSTNVPFTYHLPVAASDAFFKETIKPTPPAPPDLSLPGPSGLQTPKAPKLSSLVKIAPKRNKKQPSSTQTKKSHTCNICTKSFQTSAKLASHQLVHTGGTPFKCEHCKKSFSSKFKLVRHVLIHSDRKPFSCTVCERTFHRKDHLKNHIKVHSPSKKIYICERSNCKKEYTSIMSYRKHLALHSAEEGSLECKICSKVFETKPDILYHLKIHAGSRTVKNPNEKKFTCDYCERKFFTRKDVRRHLVVHTGTRNFLCQFCPQRFGRKDHLVRHIKKSHSKNYAELETSQDPITSSFDLDATTSTTSYDVKQETKLELPILEYSADEKSSDIKLEEIPGVQNLLFSQSFTELSPMLCSEPESLQLLQPEPLPIDTELLQELDVIKEELEQGIGVHDVVAGSSTGLIVEGDLDSQQLLPSDMMDSDLLRLISEGGNQLTDDDNNLPLPGFSQVFKQQDPPS